MALLILLQIEIPPAKTGSSLSEIIGAVTGLITALGIIYNIYLSNKNRATTQNTNEKMHEVAGKVDGLLEQKAIADEAIGKVKGIEQAQKEKAIGDDRELKVLREQQLLNQSPLNSGTSSDVADVKNEIVKTLETEIHKKGEEMKKAVEDKGDDIKQEVEKVPDEVVKKLPPK